MMGITCIIGSIISFQMSLQSSGNQSNSIIFIVLFTLLKSWLYAAPPAFCITFHPVHLLSGVYGQVMIPSIGFQLLISPLFDLILSGDSLADADFAPVSYGFGVACFLCLACAAYTLHFGIKDRSIFKSLVIEKTRRKTDYLEKQ